MKGRDAFLLGLASFLKSLTEARNRTVAWQQNQERWDVEQARRERTTARLEEAHEWTRADRAREAAARPEQEKREAETARLLNALRALGHS